MQAEFYYQQGADEICFLDISASSEGRSTTIEMVKNIAKKCFIPITVGGGVANIEDFSNLIKSGADKVSINSSAIRNPQLISEASRRFGSQAVVVAIDAKKVDNINQALGIGKWAIGGSKLIYAYDAGQYEREREDRIRRGGTDLPYLEETGGQTNNMVYEFGGVIPGQQDFYESQGGFDVAQEDDDDF